MISWANASSPSGHSSSSIRLFSSASLRLRIDFGLGEPREGRLHLEQALALYDPARHGDMAIFHPFDPRVASCIFLGLALLALGYPAQALQRSGEAIQAGRELRHRYSLAMALFFSSVLHQLLGHRQRVLDLADELISLASEQDSDVAGAG
jgi:hypothetical protein